MWGTAESRKLFFEQYAKEVGFDPLLPDNWYLQPQNNILSRKVFYFYYLFLSSVLSPIFNSRERKTKNEVNLF